MVKKPNKKLKDPEIILTAKEIKLAKILASNDKKLRDKTLKRLQKWLTFRSQSSMGFTEQDFMPLWKGLFYCMWMSDKLLPQEECAEMISKLIHNLHGTETQFLFFKCFLKTMINEWFGIDQYRLNKFLMLVRRALRQALYCIKKTSWDLEIIKNFNQILVETVLNHQKIVPLGLALHFIEIYLEELAKVGNEKIDEDRITEFVRPFAKQVVKFKDTREISQIVKFIFRYLIKQSDLGIEYQEKFKAWRQRGFPGGTIDAMQKVEESDEEETDQTGESPWVEEAVNEDDDNAPKDPRAGQVDVLLPQIKFNPTAIADMIISYKFDKESTPNTRKIMTNLVKEFKQLAKGEYPYGIKTVYQPTEKDYEATNIQAAAERLMRFEEKLTKTDKVDRKLTKAEKRLLRSQNFLINDETEGETPETSVKPQKRKLKEDVEESKSKPNKKKQKLSKSSESDLEKFINESEGDLLPSLLKTKKSKLKTSPLDLLKDSGCENGDIKIGIDDTGGVWQVTETEKKDTDKKEGKKILKKDKKLKQPLVKKKEKNKNSKKMKLIKESKEKLKKTDEKVENITLSHENSVDNAPSEPNLIENQNVLNNNSLFAENLRRNDPPSIDGETEIFVPSKKFIQKAKQQGKNINKLLTEINDKIAKEKKTKQLVQNPFAEKNKISPKTRKITPKSFTTDSSGKKKVRIVLSLNKSQDTRDYQKQVLRSPAIPYDAEKKPTKPLLKNKSTPSPINPFYKLNKFLR